MRFLNEYSRTLIAPDTGGVPKKKTNIFYKTLQKYGTENSKLENISKFQLDNMLISISK